LNRTLIDMKRCWFVIAGIALTVMIFVIYFLNYQVSRSTKAFIFDNAKLLPNNKVGVLLGTSKNLRKGSVNEFWKNRIDATISLFSLGKIKCIIISGDNSKMYYNEPIEMKKELVKLGIPDSVIYLDYAGFRTFDSMIRAYKIFGQSSFTVISQKFHNERAVYIARHYGINAIGFNAKEVSAYNGFKTALREKFARVKLFMDFLFDRQPKFLGEKVLIK
jgi:SanA protein